MRVQELCWGSSHSEHREMKTRMSVWHATVRGTCLSLQSWPLSEVRHISIFFHLTGAFLPCAHTWVQPSSQVPWTVSCRSDRAKPHPASDCRLQSAVLFIVPLQCDRAWSGHKRGKLVWWLKGTWASWFAVITMFSILSQALNLMYMTSLEGNISNVVKLKHFIK